MKSRMHLQSGWMQFSGNVDRRATSHWMSAGLEQSNRDREPNNLPEPSTQMNKLISVTDAYSFGCAFYLFK